MLSFDPWVVRPIDDVICCYRLYCIVLFNSTLCTILFLDYTDTMHKMPLVVIISYDVISANPSPVPSRSNANQISPDRFFLLAEIFLSFCSFVRQLGAGGAPMVTLEVLANGETVTKAEEFNIQQKEAVVASGLEHDEPKEVRYDAS